MEKISCSAAPPPAGHYSQAIKANGFVFVSGMLPVGSGPGATFEEQAQCALEHCAKVLDAAGASLNDVVQATAYIVGIANWPAFNMVYARFFGMHKPARAIVPVAELHHGFLVEVQLVAQCN